MTVHTAKGLEFPVVFITGLEEKIFPHARSVDDDSAVEEERRLCYVAVTRARRQLYLSRVRRRRLSGQELPGVPSRFLRDLPAGGRRVDRHGAAGRVQRLQRRRGAAPGAVAGRATSAMCRGARRAARLPRRARRAARAPAHTPGEIGSNTTRTRPEGLQVGAKLRHASFGVGEVRGWQGSGNGHEGDHAFPAVGVKTILARFLARP